MLLLVVLQVDVEVDVEVAEASVVSAADSGGSVFGQRAKPAADPRAAETRRAPDYQTGSRAPPTCSYRPICALEWSEGVQMKTTISESIQKTKVMKRSNSTMILIALGHEGEKVRCVAEFSTTNRKPDA